MYITKIEAAKSMENPNTVQIVSTQQVDYGSTRSQRLEQNQQQQQQQNLTLTNSSNSLTEDEALRLRFSTHSSTTNPEFGYQSLPSTYSQSSTISGVLTKSATKANRSHPRQQNTFILLSSSSSHYHKMSVDTMPNSETRQILQRLEYFLNVINHICIGFVTIYMSWLCLRTGLAGTALHAWFCTIGFSFLMAEGIMCHYSGNVLTFNYKRTTKTTIHWILQALGGGCGVAGALIKMIQKGFLLQSTHGKLGFSVFLICLFSMFTGLSALFSMNVKKMLNPLLNKTFHNCMGLITFTVALITQYYGYETGFFSRKVSTDFRTLIQVITLLSLVLTCFGPLKALYHKFCNIIRHFN